jgi:hypothetical protein
MFCSVCVAWIRDWEAVHSGFEPHRSTLLHCSDACELRQDERILENNLGRVEHVWCCNNVMVEAPNTPCKIPRDFSIAAAPTIDVVLFYFYAKIHPHLKRQRISIRLHPNAHLYCIVPTILMWILDGVFHSGLSPSHDIIIVHFFSFYTITNHNSGPPVPALRYPQFSHIHPLSLVANLVTGCTLLFMPIHSIYHQCNGK